MAVSSKELIGRAHELAPLLARRALETERNRAPLDDTVKQLIDAGLLGTLVPAAYGGHELPVSTMSEIVRVLSTACPSTGWVSAFYQGAAWRLLAFPEAAQREIYDKPYVLSAGQAAPLREAIRVPGGYRISGQTPWGSGSTHAEWILFVGLVQESNAPPHPTMFVVPRSETTLVDTWFVAGMRGTASNDLRVDDVFVPDHRSASFVAALEGRAEGVAGHDNPMYHRPLIPFLMCEVVPVVVGALRGAATAFVERVRGREGTVSGQRAAGKPASQMRLARGLAAADAAEVLLREYLRRFEAEDPSRFELGSRASMKLAASFLVDFCRNETNALARGFGADGFRDESPLQRYFRDNNMLAVHAFLDIDTAAETAGRLALGLAAEDPIL